DLRHFSLQPLLIRSLHRHRASAGRLLSKFLQRSVALFVEHFPSRKTLDFHNNVHLKILHEFQSTHDSRLCLTRLLSHFMARPVQAELRSRFDSLAQIPDSAVFAPPCARVTQLKGLQAEAK